MSRPAELLLLLLSDRRLLAAPEFGGLSEVGICSRLIPLGHLDVAPTVVGLGELRVEFDGFRVIINGSIQIVLGILDVATFDKVHCGQLAGWDSQQGRRRYLLWSRLRELIVGSPCRSSV